MCTKELVFYGEKFGYTYHEVFYMEETLKKIGITIRRQRLAREMSTQQLAEALGVSAGLLNNIENAKTDTFNLELLHKFCSTLHISILELLIDGPQKVNTFTPYLSTEYKDMIEESIEKDIDLIKQNLKKIIGSYIEAVSKIGYKEELISVLTDKLIYEMNYMGKITCDYIEVDRMDET